jgi:membrane-associated protein
LELIGWLIDLVLNLDAHLSELLAQHGAWIYAILFLIIFAETGFVVTPFLPGDSLLFAVGALAAIDSSGTLTAPLAAALLFVAAVLGNTCNYHIGRLIGPAAFSGSYRLFKVEYLRMTEDFYARHGGKTLVLARFVPIVRTFAPFVAGIGRMPHARFQSFNLLGAALWIVLLIAAGYFFGNIPLVKDNFGLVTVAIIIVSVLPAVWAIVRDRRRRR